MKVIRRPLTALAGKGEAKSVEKKACTKNQKKKTKQDEKKYKIERKVLAKMEKLGLKHTGTEDSTLKRTTGDSAQEKFRITFEARHIIGNYFGEGDPWEKNDNAALVVKGVHARLSNIADDGTWIKTEKYVYAGHEYTRYAGRSAGQVLRSYVELRRLHPEWFAELDVFSQPAAVVDSVIMKWMLEDQAARFPCSIWVRDMLAAGQSVNTRLAQALSQQLGVRVFGGVTCVIQLTDTDYSWSFKNDVRKAQDELRRDMKAAAAVTAEVPKFKCGPREIVKIIFEAQQAQTTRCEEKPWILTAARRNGYLHWRPNLDTGKLEPAGDQEWAEDKPEGCYRYPSRWLEERGSWLSSAGKPGKTSLADIQDAEKFAKRLEADFCREEGFYQIVKSTENKMKHFEAHAEILAEEVEHGQQSTEFGANAEDLIAPKMRRKIHRAMAAMEEAKVENTKRVKREQSKMKRWSNMQVFLKKGQDQMKTMLKTMTRAEALQTMIPEAGAGKAKKQKKKGEKVEDEKVEEEKKHKLVKGKFLSSIKTKVKEFKAMEALEAQKEKKEKKKKGKKKGKKNAKTKPCAKTKPSLKSKPSALKKAAKKDVMRAEVKAKKRQMKKSMEGYEGGMFKALKKRLRDKGAWKEAVVKLANAQKATEDIANAIDAGASYGSFSFVSGPGSRQGCDPQLRKAFKRPSKGL